MNFRKIVLMVSFIVLLFACNSSTKKSEPITTQPSRVLSKAYISDLIFQFSGKTFDYAPGDYIKNKTFALFIDKHNWPFENDIITAELLKNNLLAMDSSDLQTVVLIYQNSLPLNNLINQKKLDPNVEGFHICFVDKNSMKIKKVAKVNCLYNSTEIYSKIASAIVKEF